RLASALLLRLRRRGQEVVGLVAARARDRESAGLDELAQERKLLEERLVEDASRLVRLEGLVPVGRRLEGVPRDEHRPRLLGLPEAREHAREADDRPR